MLGRGLLPEFSAAALAEAESHPDGLTVIQAVLDRMDVPELMSDLARALGQANARGA